MNACRWLFRAFFARIGWVLAGLVLLFLGVDAKAYEYKAKVYQPGWGGDIDLPDASSPGPFHSAQELCAGWQTFQQSRGRPYVTAATATAELTLSRTTEIQCTYTDTRPAASSYVALYNFQARCDASSPWVALPTTAAAMGCVNQCPLAAGTQVASFATNNHPTNAYCQSNCLVRMETTMTVEGVGDLYGLIVQTGTAPNAGPLGGANCSGSETPNTETPGECIGDPQQCQTKDVSGAVDGPTPTPETDTDDWSGANWDNLTSSGCVTTESGGMFCIASAPNPRPDTGVPGTVAPPDQTTTYKGPAAAPGETATTVNYYTSTTVNNSTNLGSGDPDGTGSDSSGECEPGDTTCEGGGRGDGRVHGSGLGTAKTFGASAGSLWGSIQGSPLGSAVGGIAAGMPTGGACPLLAFDAPIIGSISTDIHCQIWSTNIAPVLSLVFLSIWALIAVRILMSA